MTTYDRLNDILVDWLDSGGDVAFYVKFFALCAAPMVPVVAILVKWA